MEHWVDAMVQEQNCEKATWIHLGKVRLNRLYNLVSFGSVYLIQITQVYLIYVVFLLTKVVLSHILLKLVFTLLQNFQFVLFFYFGDFVEPSFDILSFNNSIISLHLLTGSNHPQTFAKQVLQPLRSQLLSLLSFEFATDAVFFSLELILESFDFFQSVLFLFLGNLSLSLSFQLLK